MASNPRYRIVSTIGRGGMGEVCLADDLMLDRQVALKFIVAAGDVRAAEEQKGLERLLTEARAAAALDHPFICSIYEVTSLGGRPCIAMEYVRGEPLDRRLRRGPLPIAEAMRAAEEIAEALDAAHKRRVVHRDLKPANVILTDDGHVRVMDFGLATRLPASEEDDELREATIGDGSLKGTPAYMAPETIRGEPADRRSDIFAFGVLLYELVAGINPFVRPTVLATLTAILEDDVPPLRRGHPDVPEALERVVAQLVVKDRAARYQSFGDVRADLRRAALQASSQTTHLSFAARAPHASGEDPHARAGSAFVGRDAERAQLFQSLDHARAGRGSLVLIFGDPGAGKTRLAEEVLARARTLHCQTFAGRAAQHEGTPALLPYIEALEEASRLMHADAFRRVVEPIASELARLIPELHRLFPDMPPPLELPAEMRQRYLFTTIRDFLARCGKMAPVVVFIDDLQWADAATLQLTRFLAHQITALPILVVGAFREHEPHAAPPARGKLQGILDRVRGQSSEALSPPAIKTELDALVAERAARPIVLRPFTPAEIQTALAAMGRPNPPPRLVGKIAHHTGGNPFFVTELFRHLNDEGRLIDSRGQWPRDVDLETVELPHSVRAVLERRLQRVSPESLNVLRAAAIVGRDFDPDILEAVAQVDDTVLARALDEAEQARLVRGPSGRRDISWRFSDELIRQSLASALAPYARQKMHLRAADAMTRMTQRSRMYTAAIAHHLYCAGRLAEPDRTAHALIAAGDAAQAAYATQEAIDHYRRALEVLDEAQIAGDTRELVEETLADLLSLAGNREAAMAHYTRLAGRHRNAGAATDAARIARKTGTLHWHAGDRSVAMASYRQALDELSGSAAHIEMAHLYHELGLAAFRSGDNAQAIDWSERALGAAERSMADASHPDSTVRRAAAAAIAHATNTIGVALARSGDLDAARQRIERSLALAQDLGLMDVACRAYANLGVLYSSLEPRRAVEVSLTGLEIASRIGAASLESYIYANLAAAYCALTDGCETDGLQAAEQSALLDRQLGQLDHLAVPLVVMAQIHQCRGELDRSLQMYQEALAIAEKIGEPQLVLPCYDGLATIHLDRGDRTQAEAYMLKSRELCERTGLDPDALLLLPFLCLRR